MLAYAADVHPATTADPAGRLRLLLHRAVWHALQAGADGAPGGSGRPNAHAPAHESSAHEFSVQEALQAACALARAEGLRAEQVVVGLKAAWHQVPEARRRLDRQDELARVVTRCIRAFYAPDAAPGGVPHGPPNAAPARAAGRGAAASA